MSDQGQSPEDLGRLISYSDARKCPVNGLAEVRISRHVTRDTNPGDTHNSRKTATSNDISNTVLTLWSPFTGVSFRPSRRISQSGQKNSRSCCWNTSPQSWCFIPKSRMAAPLPGKLHGCWKRTENFWLNNDSLRKPKSKYSTCLLLVQKCKYPSYHIHRAGSCNFNQSRAEAVSLALSSPAWEGRERIPKSSTQSSTGLPGHEQIMSLVNARRAFKRANTLIRRAVQHAAR